MNEYRVEVSVITPVHNGAKYLLRVVESVKRQNSDVEHILVDDCSNDDSWEIMQYLASVYLHIRVFKLQSNSGPVIARNVAIAAATGRYLAFLDVDDFWLPEKLEKQLVFMRKMNCAISFTDYRIVSQDGRQIGRLVHGLAKIGWRLHHMTRYLGCLTIIIDREKIHDFIFLSVSSTYRAEDFLAWSKVLVQTGSALRCPFDLARYSLVPNSRSSKIIPVTISVWKLYRIVEKISLIPSIFYFISYIVFALLKRIYCRPHFSSETIDKDCSWYFL